jgi:hypothetical protein
MIATVINARRQPSQAEITSHRMHGDQLGRRHCAPCQGKRAGNAGKAVRNLDSLAHLEEGIALERERLVSAARLDRVPGQRFEGRAGHALVPGGVRAAQVLRRPALGAQNA